MRFLLVFICFFGVNLLGKNIEEGLKYLEIPNSKRQILKEAIRELYKQRQNYHSNDVILEYKILKEIANKGYGEVNFNFLRQRYSSFGKGNTPLFDNITPLFLFIRFGILY